MRRASHKLAVLVRTRLWAQILVAMAMGVAVGTLLTPRVGIVPTQELAETIGAWLALPGLIFLQLISMIVLPLVFSSIVLGLASSENASELKRVGLRVAPYFIMTTVAACVIGLGAGALLRPGDFIPDRVRTSAIEEARAQDRAADAQGSAADTEGKTPETEPTQPDASQDTPAAETPDAAVPEPPTFTRPTLAEAPSALVNLLPASPTEAAVNRNMLQWVFFSLVVGVALVQMPARVARPAIDVLGAVQEVCMTVIKWAMLIAPAAVFGLLAQVTVRIGPQALLAMSAYMGTVLAALLAVMAMFLLIAFVLGGVGPAALLSKSREVLLLAFATSSSAAVMPLSIRVAEEKLGVRPAIARFLVPLGATVNMAGTAAYQCVATMFLVQVYGVELTGAQLALVVATAVGASIGAPASPGVGIVILAMILATVNVPPGGIALIIGVDRLLDMARTSVNVAGDLVACVVLGRLVGPGGQPDTPGAEAAAGAADAGGS
ncbi:MAG: dicarboxylate/amino acid:cation symporter [Phycisphaerales bacterium JB060]